MSPVQRPSQQRPAQSVSPPPRKHFSDSSRIGLSVSLGVHLLLLLFALFYVVDQHYAEDPFVAVDISELKRPPKSRRRVLPPVTRIASPQTPNSTTPRFRNIPTTAAEIPVVSGEMTVAALPSLMLNEQPGEGLVQDWGGLGRRTMVSMHRAETIRPTVSVTSATPPRLEIATEVQGISTEPLELTTLEARTPVIPLSQATRLPRFINKIVPRYPELAKRAGKEGVVILEAEISSDGTAENIVVIQGMGYGCDESAIAALRASRFFPAYRGDQRVTVKIQIPYRFRFEEM